jgi:hypothetical protein
MGRSWVGAAALAAAVALGACHQKVAKAGSDAAAASTPPAGLLEPPAPATPAAPLAYTKKTADAEVALTLAPDIARWPRLHREVYARGVADLRRFADQAGSDRSSVAGSDNQPGLYARDLDWKVSAATPRLVSLIQAWYENDQAAHPNHGYDSYLWDVAANRSVGNAALFSAGDDKAIEKALCDGIDKAKRDRGAVWDPEANPCPKWRESRFVLAPSTVPGKVGGLVFLFDPDDIGAYAEGDYQIPLPQALFRPVLAPAYADQFAGEPRQAPRKAG